ncbi:PTS glucitol/sorbitol transporter subunit IIA [Salibacterium halotolerans]|uniref:PTS system, glucitol/sorbitol-specific IIA component n=1 Tax=Salibacterium halotolerans TaxID=1884432 RepID=A0A1I5TGB0_9BACI|nr:PTS glucitol/sorbitol transporter subunit IIA [Salibacterium halotolerans]SFP81446.1 PTS system, glucitol/sorbitol-specific IIA component [Salibacterium halotolerans]
MTVYFEADVTTIGPDVELMLEDNMLILFNESATDDLKEISVIHNGTTISEVIESGDEFVIDGKAYKILFVGSKVNETMNDLGHATLQFNGETESDMPGTVCLEEGISSDISEISKIQFRKNS